MNVEVPSIYQSLVQRLITQGRFHSEADVVAEGLRLIDAKERLREEVETGIAELDAGNRIEASDVYAEAKRRIDQGR